MIGNAARRALSREERAFCASASNPAPVRLLHILNQIQAQTADVKVPIIETAGSEDGSISLLVGNLLRLFDYECRPKLAEVLLNFIPSEQKQVLLNAGRICDALLCVPKSADGPISLTYSDTIISSDNLPCHPSNKLDWITAGWIHASPGREPISLLLNNATLRFAEYMRSSLGDLQVTSYFDDEDHKTRDDTDAHDDLDKTRDDTDDHQDLDYYPVDYMLKDDEGYEHLVPDIGIDFDSYEEYESYQESNDPSD